MPGVGVTDARQNLARDDPARARTRQDIDAAFAAKYGLVDTWYGALLRRGAIPIRLDPRD